ncbi:MAG: folylpolyglutamate synthase/dihydrofolate synthase family protein [Pseudomonadota bacterium]
MDDRPDMDPATSLKRFEALSRGEIDLSLDRIERVMSRLGSPHRHLPPVIHVAGTNGKGSTCAFLRAMAEAAGLNVHVFTSPHLVRVNECIRLSGEQTSDAVFCSLLDRVYDGQDDEPLTSFEALTAAAFLAFAEKPADLLVLEVGLGGRGDATNIVPNPVVSVITPVAFDHERFLGNGLGQIGWHKAGIIKSNTPVVSARQDDIVAQVIAEEALARGAPLYRLRTSDLRRIPADTALRGSHQLYNAALAALALSVWGHQDVTAEAVEKGARTAVWPARMQRLSTGAVVDLAGLEEVWLDGGHNPHAAKAVASLLSDMPGETALVSAMMAGKDHEATFRAYAGVASQVFTCPNADGYANASPRELADAARRAGLAARSFRSFEAALRAAGQSGASRILICGSLRLAGAVLEANGEAPDGQSLRSVSESVAMLPA